MTTEELKKTANYLDKLSDHIPNGLWALKDAVSFACVDIIAYTRFGVKCKNWDNLIEFISTIPVVDNWEDEKLTHWMVHSIDYEKYMPLGNDVH